MNLVSPLMKAMSFFPIFRLGVCAWGPSVEISSSVCGSRNVGDWPAAWGPGRGDFNCPLGKLSDNDPVLSDPLSSFSEVMGTSNF